MLDHLAIAAQFLIDLSDVVVAVAGDRNDVLVPDGAKCLPVLNAELGKAPLAAEILGEEDLEEAEHALGVLGQALLWVLNRT